MVYLLINYGTLDKVLTHFGFEKKALEEDRIAYFHRKSDTLLVYPLTPADEQVSSQHLMATRKMLTDRVGIAEAELRRVVLSAFYEMEWIQTKNGE